MKLACALLACALAASAVEIDGVWTAQTTPRKGKAADKPAATFTLDLKTRDGKITGTVSMAGKRKPVVLSVQNGKLDGDRLSFTTVQHSKKADVAFSWQATAGAGQIDGTRTREGAKRGVPFTAKRSN